MNSGARFEAEHPLILGAVLDAVAGGMRELPLVKLPRLPRMADFAKWGEAVGRGAGWGPEAFLSAYEDNRLAATEMSLEGSVVGAALLERALERLEWDGTPTELFESLTHWVGRGVARSTAWPKSTRMFMNGVRRLAPQLRMKGVFMVASRTRESRRVQIATEGRFWRFSERPGSEIEADSAPDELARVPNIPASRHNLRHHRILHLKEPVFRIFQRHALNTCGRVVYDEKPVLPIIPSSHLNPMVVRM